MKINLSQKELDIIIGKMDDKIEHSDNYNYVLQYLIEELRKAEEIK
jgi:hypothetical protein